MVADYAADVRDALDRVASERGQMLAKQQAVERSERRVRKLTTQSARPPTGTTQAAACGITSVATVTQRDDAADKGQRRVRELFAEVIHPHSVSDVSEFEPLVATVHEEFSPEIATAFSPGVGGRFTSVAKEAVVSAAAEQQQGLDEMCQAPDSEEQSFRAVPIVLDEYEDWVARAGETLLSEPGFDALRRRHETLASHRKTYDRLIHERQRHLNGVTRHTAAAEVDHRFLAMYLYEDRATDYPVLTATTRVDDSHADCQ